MMPFLRTTLFLAVLLSLTGVWVGAGQARPNIIFFLADDLGYADLSVQGSTDISTPCLDQMAAEGGRFEQFYVNAPICSASRTSFVTGQYAQRWNITSAITYRRENEERGMADYLKLTAPSLGAALHEAGYATAHFGKWHLGGGRDVDYAPLVAEYGFDEVLTQFEGLGDRILPVFSRPMRPRWGGENRHPLGVESSQLGHGSFEFVPRFEMTGRWLERTLAFIKDAQAKGKPFYVNVWPDDPHSPVEPSPARRGDGSIPVGYKAVVEELDRDFGRLFDFVRHDPELRENTVIVFASDNGPERGYGSAGIFRGAKTNLYEGGICVPFIVWSPRFISAERGGFVDTRSVILGMDFTPTVLAIAGVESAENRFDGENKEDAWFGEPSDASRTVFWTRPPDQPGKDGEAPDAAVRRGVWKLLVHDRSHSAELYNLACDPGEAHNQVDREPGIAAQLSSLLRVWRAETPGRSR